MNLGNVKNPASESRRISLARAAATLLHSTCGLMIGAVLCFGGRHFLRLEYYSFYLFCFCLMLWASGVLLVIGYRWKTATRFEKQQAFRRLIIAATIVAAMATLKAFDLIVARTPLALSNNSIVPR